MSQNWTIDEASADIAGLLEAARASSQYILAPDGAFKVSFERKLGRSINELLENDAHLKKDDVDGI
ncbi:hypothetical protein ACFSE1_06130 [Rhizobium helianthi]|uniref:Uncharacterized protein n=1 Tax=Rhizobium helianthi TaxID=1132695 RepID=A0ABW4M0S5_9HYPH